MVFFTIFLLKSKNETKTVVAVRKTVRVTEIEHASTSTIGVIATTFDPWITRIDKPQNFLQPNPYLNLLYSQN